MEEAVEPLPSEFSSEYLSKHWDSSSSLEADTRGGDNGHVHGTGSQRDSTLQLILHVAPRSSEKKA